jgi:ABC-type polysaccharide/polyol phosphate export permease
VSKLSEITASRELIVNFTLRDLRSRYKRSVLGWAWSMLNPLSTVIVYTVVFKYFFKAEGPVGQPSGLKNFSIYLFCGLTAWSFFSASINGAMGVLVGNAGLIKKVYFPRENLVLAAIISNVVSFLIELGLACVILLVLGNNVLPWLPVIALLVFLEMVFVVGLGLVVAVANAYFRDVQYLVGSVLLQVLFYLTPIVYDVKQAEEAMAGHTWLWRLYTANPTVQFVEAFHRVMYDLRWPTASNFGYLIGVSAASLVVGLWIFNRFDGNLAEEL